MHGKAGRQSPKALRVSLGALSLLACVFAGSLTANAKAVGEQYVFRTFAGAAAAEDANSSVSSVSFSLPSGVAVDNSGNIYVADTDNHAIRKIAPDGVASLLAGVPGKSGSADGPRSAARFYYPKGLAVDNAGNVYVADTANHTIRKITADGVVTTLAGLAGSIGYSDGEGGTARFYYPSGIATDRSGNLYVADTFNSTLRFINRARVVRTVAGLAGSVGSADGRGAAARFNYPVGVATDRTGRIYVADAGNQTIRRVTLDGSVTTFAGSPGRPGSADGDRDRARFN
jgi:sugar lactone lactonase YvrE